MAVRENISYQSQPAFFPYLRPEAGTRSYQIFLRQEDRPLSVPLQFPPPLFLPYKAQGDEITVYVANLTNPDGQVSLADSYVVWAEETPMSNDIYTPAWIPTGMPTRLCYDVTSTKKLDEIYDNIDDYSAQSVQDMLASQGISKGENSISGNYLSYVYSQGDMSMSGTYCVNSDTDPDVFVAYVAGEKNAAGLT